MKQTPDPRGLAALIFGASLLGFAAMLVRWAAPAGPLAVGFYRMAIALPFVAWLARGTARPATGRARLWAVLAGVCFVLDLWMWHSALHLTSAANATLLVTLAPIWVAVVSVLWMGARLRKRFWLGVLLALSGALVLGLAKGARWGTGLGELLGALASLAYGAFTLALGRARRELSAPEALFWVVLCCTVLFGALGWAQGEAFSGYPARSWWALIGLGTLVQVVAWWFITWGLGHVPTNLGAMGLMTQPVATIILGWVLLAESVRPLQGLGALLVLAGIALCAFAPPSSKAA
ncbi:MAG: DMT family transporter [Geothrix sp.]|uniref:DMT family transporter n=1 Tax=Candidatus Geothrix odensensis TaxID=2954440 RepID=A0A936K7A9_9BACT|nr:DMT family transporter [Holophagaceae bacterium]MBK8573966.1 DMT family transporter [Candidatus Geothrix odensensis]MBK8789268.1 DMT family transporter [Holophagaceae bacterium]MCC6514211.1 DMT family transporter [Geothrix sp.]